jgi:hypothetical protein
MTMLVDEVVPEVHVRTSAPSDDAVEAWFVDYFHNVPGLTTDLYNRFRAAADDLKARLRARET